MTLESTVCRNRYVGNGSTTQFPFAFKAWKKEQVRVYVGNGNTEQDVSAQCSITLTATGGTVAFASAPASGTVIAIRRDMPFVQQDDYRNGSRFDAEDVEDRFDQDCAERQQLLDGLGRCVKTPETSDVDGEALVAQLFQARQDALGAVEAIGGAEQVLEARDAVLAALETAGAVTGATLVTASGSTAARSIADRLADIINVKDYGAKGDGVSDDTVAIKAAIAAMKARTTPFTNAGSALGGPCIYFPFGCYLISEMLDIEWGQRLNLFLDGAVVKATASMDAMLYIHNCWAEGSIIHGGTWDLNNTASRGVWIDRTNAGMIVDGVTIRRIGSATGLWIGDEEGTARSGAAHKINNLFINNPEGASLTYANSIGVRCYVSDIYMNNTLIYNCKLPLSVKGGGNNFCNLHAWHSMSPDESAWDGCRAVYCDGTNNLFEGLYVDNYCQGLVLTGNAGKTEIGKYFFYIPTAPTVSRTVDCIRATNEAIVNADSIYTRKTANCITNLCYVYNQDYTYYNRDHAKLKKIGFALSDFDGFNPIDPAFNLTNFKFSRSPATAYQADLAAGNYLLGYLRRQAGSGVFRVSIPGHVAGDVKVSLGTDDSLTVSNASGGAGDRGNVTFILGAAETLDGDDVFTYHPVYLGLAEAISNASIHIDHTDAAGQDFFLWRRTSYSSLVASSITEHISTDFS